MITVIGQDKEGNDLYPGDIVLTEDGVETKIEFGKYREKFNNGYVVGFYIPDFCLKKK
jgi:hypothetical protein